MGDSEIHTVKAVKIKPSWVQIPRNLAQIILEIGKHMTSFILRSIDWTTLIVSVMACITVLTIFFTIKDKI